MNSKLKRVYKPKLLDVKNLHQVSEGCWKVLQSSSLEKKNANKRWCTACREENIRFIRSLNST